MATPPNLFRESTAQFSQCARYRYRLTRVWNEDLPTCGFLLLNPSTADAQTLDPTLKRTVHFATREGCGAIMILNLFARRSAHPRVLRDELRAGLDIIGPENDYWIQASLLAITGPLIVGWGTERIAKTRAEEVRRALGRHTVALDINGDDSPKHPLYVKGDSPLIPYPPIQGF